MSEEILIDGVNVAGCEFAVKPKNDNRIKCHCAKGLLQIAKMQEQPESIKSGLCENNPNCSYKQFKRLQAESEELKSKIKNNANAHQIELGVYNTECANLLQENAEHSTENRKYRKALKEIREYASAIEKEELIAGYAIRAKSALWRIVKKINEVLE